MRQIKQQIYSKESQNKLSVFFNALYEGCLGKEVCQKFYIVSEEYITNFFKYGKKKSDQVVWFVGQEWKDKFVGCFLDNGDPFDPFDVYSNAVGVRLMTALFYSRYRRLNGFNCFRFYISTNKE